MSTGDALAFTFILALSASGYSKYPSFYAMDELRTFARSEPEMGTARTGVPGSSVSSPAWPPQAIYTATACKGEVLLWMITHA